MNIEHFILDLPLNFVLFYLIVALVLVVKYSLDSKNLKEDLSKAKTFESYTHIIENFIQKHPLMFKCDLRVELILLYSASENVEYAKEHIAKIRGVDISATEYMRDTVLNCLFVLEETGYKSEYKSLAEKIVKKYKPLSLSPLSIVLDDIKNIKDIPPRYLSKSLENMSNYYKGVECLENGDCENAQKYFLQIPADYTSSVYRTAKKKGYVE